ncbi:3D domain-containing protein [Solibacillus isronensis]|uniref:3D domain-containing protein n=1 Tax=Solibacillus isronensis TaxID=412383 RepID=UPI0009A758B4|nr:3D domain-containing protein [Solibacillus isronensis]
MFQNKLLFSFAFFVVTTLFFANATIAATHTVKKGEELDEIAERYDTSVYTLLELNEVNDIEEVTEGFVLKLPDHIKNKKAPVEKKEKKETIDDFEVVKTLTVEASAFTAYCKGCSGKTASGIDLKKNPDIKLIAVDPKIIPLGTKVWVEGYGIAVAGDTGGSIKGNRIDVFVKTKKTALNWGRKNVEIKVLK